MRFALNLILPVLVFCVACTKESETPLEAAVLEPDSGTQSEEPEEEELPQEIRDLQWTTVSNDSKGVVNHVADRNFRCTVTCTVGEEERWSMTTCLGKRLDLRFVSNDCDKLVILHQLPKVLGSWSAAEVAHIYKRGVLEYAVQAGGVVRDEKKLRSAGTTFYWLAGVLGIPGVAPRYAADGSAVEFDTVDGKQQSIPFVTPPRPEPAKSHPPKKKNKKHRR